MTPFLHLRDSSAHLYVSIQLFLFSILYVSREREKISKIPLKYNKQIENSYTIGQTMFFKSNGFVQLLHLETIKQQIVQWRILLVIINYKGRGDATFQGVPKYQHNETLSILDHCTRKVICNNKNIELHKNKNKNGRLYQP